MRAHTTDNLLGLRIIATKPHVQIVVVIKDQGFGSFADRLAEVGRGLREVDYGVDRFPDRFVESAINGNLGGNMPNRESLRRMAYLPCAWYLECDDYENQNERGQVLKWRRFATYGVAWNNTHVFK